VCVSCVCVSVCVIYCVSVGLFVCGVCVCGSGVITAISESTSVVSKRRRTERTVECVCRVFVCV